MSFGDDADIFNRFSMYSPDMVENSLKMTKRFYQNAYLLLMVLERKRSKRKTERGA